MGKAVERVNPGRKRVRFAQEFKLEAVKLLEAGHKPATQIALELGIRRHQRYKWQAQLGTKGEVKAFRGPGCPAAGGIFCSRTSAARTQARHRGTRHFKKAAAYFAQELP